MTQNIAEDFEVRATVDLSAGVTVAKHMCSKRRCLDPGETGVKANPMADGAACKRFMRQPCVQEDQPSFGMTWPFKLKIGGKRSCDCRQ